MRQVQRHGNALVDRKPVVVVDVGQQGVLPKLEVQVGLMEEFLKELQSRGGLQGLLGGQKAPE